ncbi:lipopolysaccharide assembly protein LapB [Sporosarcina pasteurii]|uniref:Tetratricopeptide repeat protein n=1 Tax=Sporosarcina pasteurii TaxID=1474 RepID=A0A380C9R4_SPOPA|nr:tetratricopeptide repeat protein [Sporosarcina pasteurii]MDS9472684.1 tetratricopeptide repeat protein [Sporosarcina pasteurii]QBQ04344.1 tetratricopeptide repeat protein [Sporosarcina pasteurii]SUJ15821.1 tetratricopeptide repeat protein [Sporosarcina pasteurii]
MNKKRVSENRKVISFIPDGEFYYKKAIQAMQRDCFEEAHKYLKRATELSPGDPLILMQYGVLVMEEGRFHDAQEILQQAYTLDTNASEIVFYLAEVHAHLGLLSEAKAYAEKYLIMDVSGPFNDEAKEIIDFAEQNEPSLDEEDSEVLLLQEKARRQMETGEFKEAIDLLEAIITDYPDFWAAYNNLALAYFYVGKKKEANDVLHDVLEQNKGNLHALCNLAVFYYYEKNEEQLAGLLELLLKLKPYLVEHRYKLGATFALVGKHKEAFSLLRQLQKQGFEGDAGFYFWLSHSAYLMGHENIARKAYATLLEMDPTKEGYEPWRDIEKELSPDSVEHDRQFLLNKIQNQYRSERMLGFYLLGKSAHKQEILSHPSYIKIEELSEVEKLFLASGIRNELLPEGAFEKAFTRALETTELLYEQYGPLDYESTHLFQMWFTLCEKAISVSYEFPNPAALASAADYMFQSARYSGVTKIGMAKKYGVSTPTLTKYVNELIEFLPHLNG